MRNCLAQPRVSCRLGRFPSLVGRARRNSGPLPSLASFSAHGGAILSRARAGGPPHCRTRPVAGSDAACCLSVSVPGEDTSRGGVWSRAVCIFPSALLEHVAVKTALLAYIGPWAVSGPRAIYYTIRVALLVGSARAEGHVSGLGPCRRILPSGWRPGRGRLPWGSRRADGPRATSRSATP